MVYTIRVKIEFTLIILKNAKDTFYALISATVIYGLTLGKNKLFS